MAQTTRSGLGKALTIVALTALVFVALIFGKWYNTAAREPIDPQRGVYGMDGLEIWIDLNARMPAPLREWGCNTLREREKLALGGKNSMPPYSCQPGFGTLPDKSAYQTAADANLDQAAQGLDDGQRAALKACFEAKMAAALTPEEVQAMNDYDQSVMSKVVIAINQNARACKDEVAP